MNKYNSNIIRLSYVVMTSLPVTLQYSYSAFSLWRKLRKYYVHNCAKFFSKANNDIMTLENAGCCYRKTNTVLIFKSFVDVSMVWLFE